MTGFYVASIVSVIRQHHCYMINCNCYHYFKQVLKMSVE